MPSQSGTSGQLGLAGDTYDECVYREDTLVLLELTTRDMMEVGGAMAAVWGCMRVQAFPYLLSTESAYTTSPIGGGAYNVLSFASAAAVRRPCLFCFLNCKARHSCCHFLMPWWTAPVAASTVDVCQRL